MTPAYQSSCVFPFLLICFRVSSSRLGTRTCGTAVHLVPCLSLFSSHLLSISLSPHLIWDDNQPRSCYHSYIWSLPVVVPLGLQLWFPPVASSSSAPPFHPPYEEGPSSSIRFSCLIAVGPPCLLSLLLAPWTSPLFYPPLAHPHPPCQPSQPSHPLLPLQPSLMLQQSRCPLSSLR